MFHRMGVVAGLAAGLMSVATAQAADLPIKAPPALPAPPPPSFELFAGFAVSPDAVFGDAGGVWAFNRNLRTDGWLFRVRGGAGHYDYNRVPGLGQGVDFQVGEVMIGYQTFVGATRFSGYVGPNVESHDNPDPLATVKGTRWGIKGQGEIYTPINDRWYFFGLATVSSVYSSYFVLTKAGYNISPGISVGPELVFLGNDRFDAVRLGPFVSFDIGATAQLIFSGGYSWDTNRDAVNDHSGGYATVHVRSTF